MSFHFTNFVSFHFIWVHFIRCHFIALIFMSFMPCMSFMSFMSLMPFMPFMPFMALFPFFPLTSLNTLTPLIPFIPFIPFIHTFVRPFITSFHDAFCLCHVVSICFVLWVCYHFIHWCNNSFHFILRGFIPFYQIMSIYSIHLFICSFVHINRSLFLSCPFILSHCVSFCAMSLHFSSFQLSPFNFIWFSSFIAYVHWFHSLLHVLYSFIQSFIHAFIHSSIRSFINSCIHSIHLV